MNIKVVLTSLLLFALMPNCYSQNFQELLSISNMDVKLDDRHNCPEFYKMFSEERIKGVVKGIYFGSYSKYNDAPVFTVEKNFIFINEQLLKSKESEAYLIWSFLQSISDINYFQKNQTVDSFSFFKTRYIYSLNYAKTLAENGNCKILKTAVSSLDFINLGNSIGKQKTVISNLMKDPAFDAYRSFIEDCNFKDQNGNLKLEPITKQNKSKANEQTELKQSENIVPSKVLPDEATISKVLEDLKSRYDDMTGITSYYDKHSPKSTEEDAVYLYIRRELSGQFQLRLKVQMYTQQYFKMTGNCLIQTDNNTYPINSNYSSQKFSQLESSGWFDIVATNNIVTIMTEASNSINPKIRYYGEADMKDERFLKAKEKEALKNILKIYSVLTGK